jgi:hypothetical protein
MANAESGRLPPELAIDGASDTPEAADEAVADLCGRGNCLPPVLPPPNEIGPVDDGLLGGVGEVWSSDLR